jgi:hypothetical protein
MTARTLFVVFALLGISGCVHEIWPQDAGPYPQNYPEIVKSFVDANFYDAAALRVSMSTPRPRKDLESGQQGWIVCLLLSDRRDPYGLYGDVRVSAVVIQDGRGIGGSYELAEDCLTGGYAPPLGTPY